MKGMISRIGQVVAILLILASSFGLSGCSNEGSTINAPALPRNLPPQPSTPTSTPVNSEPVIIDDDFQPDYVNLSFPNGAPRLNQPAELHCVVGTAGLVADNVTVKINLPDGLQYVSGDLSAEFGTMPIIVKPMPAIDKKEIIAIIRPIRSGNYTIEAKLSLIFRDLSSTLGPGLFVIYLSVSDNSAEWGTVPPWLPKITPPLPITPVPQN